MENVMLINVSRQMSLRRTMDVIANNLANLNTTAFKAETVLFRDHNEPIEMPDRGRESVIFTLDYGMARNLTEGHIAPTSNPLDLAISGDGYFVVETPEGERYTRNGHFSIDAEGQLTTREGYAVLDRDGRPIAFDLETDTISISGDGSISFGQGEEDPIQLQIVEFDDEKSLKKAGTSLYEAGDQFPRPAERAQVLQGMLERSNVSPIHEMTKMIQTMRAYQSSVRSQEASTELTKKAIERLGRLNG